MTSIVGTLRFSYAKVYKCLLFLFVMFVKIHDSYRKVVAVCDSNLVGRKFEDGIKQLDVRETFFKEEEVDSEKLKKILEYEKANGATFNIVGKESVNIAKEIGLISKESVGNVGETPFALVLL